MADPDSDKSTSENKPYERVKAEQDAINRNLFRVGFGNNLAFAKNRDSANRVNIGFGLSLAKREEKEREAFLKMNEKERNEKLAEIDNKIKEYKRAMNRGPEDLAPLAVLIFIAQKRYYRKIVAQEKYKQNTWPEKVKQEEDQRKAREAEEKEKTKNADNDEKDPYKSEAVDFTPREEGTSVTLTDEEQIDSQISQFKDLQAVLKETQAAQAEVFNQKKAAAKDAARLALDADDSLDEDESESEEATLDAGAAVLKPSEPADLEANHDADEPSISEEVLDDGAGVGPSHPAASKTNVDDASDNEEELITANAGPKPEEGLSDNDEDEELAEVASPHRPAPKLGDTLSVSGGDSTSQDNEDTEDKKKAEKPYDPEKLTWKNWVADAVTEALAKKTPEERQEKWDELMDDLMGGIGAIDTNLTGDPVHDAGVAMKNLMLALEEALRMLYMAQYALRMKGQDLGSWLESRNKNKNDGSGASVELGDAPVFEPKAGKDEGEDELLEVSGVEPAPEVGAALSVGEVSSELISDPVEDDYSSQLDEEMTGDDLADAFGKAADAVEQGAKSTLLLMGEDEQTETYNRQPGAPMTKAYEGFGNQANQALSRKGDVAPEEEQASAARRNVNSPRPGAGG